MDKMSSFTFFYTQILHATGTSSFIRWVRSKTVLLVITTGLVTKLVERFSN